MAHVPGHPAQSQNELFAANFANQSQANKGTNASGFMNLQPLNQSTNTIPFADQMQGWNAANMNYGQEPMSYADMMQQRLAEQTKAPLLIGGAPKSLGQTTDIGFFGEGGYADTGISALKALGGMYLGNEQRKLAASDLDFRRDSFERQYGNQVATVNDQLYDRQRNRNLRSGMDNDAAGMAADDYVRNRGVGQERRTVR